MKNLKSIFVFGAGAVIGAIASYYVTKNKYETILQEEIDSVKETYKKKQSKVEETPVEKINEEHIEEETTSVDERESYSSILKDSGYVNYTAYSKNTNVNDKEEEEVTIDPNDAPYIINSEEFGEEVGYDTQTLTYFADGVLVDDTDDIIENIDGAVGEDNLKVFEEFGASAIYVRNDYMMIDYEILKDDFNYSDFVEPMSDEQMEIGKQKMLDNLHKRTANEKKPHQI